MNQISPKDKQLVIGGGVLVTALMLLAFAKYVPIGFASIGLAVILAMTLETGSVRERTLRYLAAFGLTTYLLLIVIGVPRTSYHGVFEAKLARDVVDATISAWNTWVQSVGQVLKGVPRDNLIDPERLTLIDIQGYLLLLLPIVRSALDRHRSPDNLSQKSVRIFA
jgi:hypothetical protein